VIESGEIPVILSSPGARQPRWPPCRLRSGSECTRRARDNHPTFSDHSTAIAVMGHPGSQARAAGMAWTRVRPLPRQFSPAATPNCPARVSVPGAVAATAREPARLQSQPDPIVVSGRAASTPGRRTQAHLGQAGEPRMSCGSMLFRAALHAEVCTVSAGSGAGLATGPGVRSSRSRSSAERGLFQPPRSLAARMACTRPALRDRLANGIAGGAVPHRRGGAPHPGRRRSRWRRAR
jgi:hypothetical protein